MFFPPKRRTSFQTTIYPAADGWSYSKTNAGGTAYVGIFSGVVKRTCTTAIEQLIEEITTTTTNNNNNNKSLV